MALLCLVLVPGALGLVLVEAQQIALVALSSGATEWGEAGRPGPRRARQAFPGAEDHTPSPYRRGGVHFLWDTNRTSVTSWWHDRETAVQQALHPSKKRENLPILFVVADGTASKPPGRYSENHGDTAPASPG